MFRRMSMPAENFYLTFILRLTNLRLLPFHQEVVNELCLPQ